METSERLKAFSRRSLRTVLSGRLYYRLGRFLWLDARRDVANDSRDNGEFKLLKAAVSLLRSRREAVFFDIGGNIGEYSEQVLKYSLAEGDRVRLYCFEPNPACVTAIEDRLRPLANRGKAEIVPLALTDSVGTVSFYRAGETAGTSSLRADGAGDPARRSERIEVEAGTMDDFCRRRGIDRVDFVKVDTEGNDMRAILGASGLLASGSIEFLQFEYNWRWVLFRNYLKDVFDLVQPLGYRVGKVAPEGIMALDKWHPELEVFSEGNYVIGRDLAAPGVPVFSSMIH